MCGWIAIPPAQNVMLLRIENLTHPLRCHAVAYSLSFSIRLFILLLCFQLITFRTTSDSERPEYHDWLYAQKPEQLYAVITHMGRS